MKRTLLFATLFAFVAISAFFAARNIKSQHPSSIKKAEPESEGKKDADGFADAAAYLNKLRANQVTGLISQADYYQARSDADYNLSHPVSRGALGLQWNEVGPDNIGGRTRAILYDKQNPGWVFAGAVSGGLWYSQTNGSSWNKVPGFDNFSSLTVSALAQGEDGSIYFGTGEIYAYLSGIAEVSGAGGFPGKGIWKSADHGSTWTQIANVSVTSGIVNNDAYSFVNHLTSGGTAYPDRIYAAIKGSPSQKGIEYWSISQSKWVQVNITSGTGYDVEVGSNGVVYAIVGVNRYFRSTDGVNFTAVNTIPGAGSSNRIELSVSAADPNYVYAINSYLPSGASYGELQGVSKSTDAGLTWTTIAPAGIVGSLNWEPVTQGEYALAITAWPGDKDIVYIGGIDCYKGVPNTKASLGYDWFKLSNWELDPTSSSYIHADIHRFVFDPANPDNMFIGSDGGLSYTTNAQATYPTFGTRNLQYNVTQFYAGSAKPYTGELLAGAQDNGNIYIDFLGNTIQAGKVVKGGDGGDVALSYKNPLAMFAEYVQGTVQRSSNNGQSFSNFFDTHIDCQPLNTTTNQCGGDGQPDDGAAFIAPILLWEDPNPASDSSKFFLGTNSGIWMTPEALNFAVTPAWFRLGNSANGAFISLAVSHDGSTVYGGTDGGGLYRITGLNSPGFKWDSAGKTFPASKNIKTTLIWQEAGRSVTSISVDVQNPDHVVFSLGNYGNTDYVYETTDSASTKSAPQFNLIQSNLPKMPVFSVFIDQKVSTHIVIGTELGVYGTADDGVSWNEENTGLNRVPVFKIRSIPVGGQDNVLYASSYGRGMFSTNTLAYTGVNNVQPGSVKGVNVYPNPAANEVFVSMQLPLSGSSVELTVFDITGRRIKTINKGKVGPGLQLIEIPTNDLTNGTYLLNIRTDNAQSNAKFIILK